jgi:arabinogalactan endo-1,4-beta-galactosidase
VLGLSYYPEHHGNLAQMEANLHTLATTYPQYKLEIAETSYPATGGGTQPNSTFPRTVQGQADAIQHVFQMVNDVVDNQGAGALLWEPASWQSMFRSVPGMTNTSEPNASIDVYNRSRATHVLEDTVYTAVEVGGAPALPETVQVLTTADGTQAAVPVAWDDLPSGATGTAGRVEVAGTTEYGEVTAVVDVVDEFAAVACDTEVSGTHYGPLAVTSGTTCLLEGSRVYGPVNVAHGAALVTDGARITGPLSANGAALIMLCGTNVSGLVSLTGSASVTLGNPVLGCDPNQVSGPVTVVGTNGWNVIAGNEISGPLSCTENDRTPANNGTANEVKGPRSGQCAGL